MAKSSTLEFVKENDGTMTAQEMAAELGISASAIYQARKRIVKMEKKVTRKSSKPTSLSPQLAMTLPDTVMVLKIRSSDGTNIGTLQLTSEGLAYTGPNKKINGSEIGWDKLEKVSDIF